MPSRPKISDGIQKQVRLRAAWLCEYCHASEKWQYVRFTVDHVIPFRLGGVSTPDNLALACFHCNRKKADRVKARDPESGREVPLFNPRTDRWADHFIWSDDGLSIVTLTPIGRATAAALMLNRKRAQSIRAADRVVGRHPPQTDPIQQ